MFLDNKTNINVNVKDKGMTKSSVQRRKQIYWETKERRRKQIYEDIKVIFMIYFFFCIFLYL